MVNIKVSIIVAMAENRVIGAKQDLLWHISDDLKRFRKITLHHAIIMGRKTFDSIGHPLENRLNIVITHDPKKSSDETSLIFVNSLEDALKIGKEFENKRRDELDKEVFIIGGGQIYNQALPLADKLYITLINDDFEGDTYFPVYDQFNRVIFQQQAISDGFNYQWIELER